MSLILSGTDGLSDIDGTAATPAIRGTDANTGIFFGADIIGFSEGGVEAMRITSAGDVGIGTSSPSTKLHVETSSTGDAFKVAKGGNYLIMGGSGSGTQYVKGYEGVVAFGNAFAGETIFLTSDTERMRITSGGNVLVNTTSNIAAGAKIFAKGNGVGIAVGYGTGSSEYRHLYMNSGDGTLYFFNDTNYASLSSAGAWTNASDARLKKNIVNIKYGLADVLRLQPRSYQMNDVAGNFVGFVAQELQTVIPEVVSGDPEKQLGVDYGSLVAVAFKAIQEQQALITALTARITALETP